MRQRERREVLSSTFFIQAIEDVRNELSKQQEFLEKAIIVPELIFSSSHQFLGLKGLSSQIMNRYVSGETKLQVHDFQVFLADLTNQFVQSWAKAHGIQEEIRVEVRQPNTYPSIFAIYLKDAELIQFSITEKYYGVRDEVRQEEQIRDAYLQCEREEKEEYDALTLKLEEYKKWIDKPHEYIRNHYRNLHEKSLRMLWDEIIEHVSIPFNKKKIIEGMNIRILELESQLEWMKRRDEVHRISVQDEISLEASKVRLIRSLLPIFKEFGYVLELNRHKLY
ncbi:hypothetical protein ACFVS2_20935 [Brevibacillus sp. NPDC058079]|uniref:hypothetical protein n=1 Tax=Brevibacillus sp. NPDC058079 TaxID=3346330 RepID=UPI0036E6DD12